MRSKVKSFPISSSVLLILFQVIIGLLGFVISGKLSHFAWLMNLLLLWLGVTFGMYLGGFPFLFQRSCTPKNSLVRLATTAVGAAIPVFLIILLGGTLGIQNATYLALAPLLAFLALGLSLLGFFIPGWFSQTAAMA